MTKRQPKPPAPPSRNPAAIPVPVKSTAQEHRDEAMAACAIAQELQAALTIRAFTPLARDEVTVNAVSVEVRKRGDAATAGDLSSGERMLAAQAIALDGIFGECARRARENMGAHTHAADLYLRLALRAQSQCRATWETLAVMKNPAPIAFVRQANIAAGPQQVNNSAAAPPPARVEQSEKPNRLLADEHGQRLDTGATGAAGRGDQTVASVGAFDRTEDARG